MPDKRMIYGKEQTTKAIGRAVFEVFFSLSTKWPKGAYPLTDGYEFTGIDTNNAIKPFITEFFAQWQRGQIRVVSYAVYQQEIDTTGQCAAFACDVQNSTDIDAVTKIKLPTITRYLRPKGLTNPIGTSGLDTLPALSGIFPTIALGDGATGLTEGVFSIADTGTMTGVNSGNNVTTTPYNTVSMDISDMVSVATEVMPRHANLALYIQIFNVDYDAVGGSENLDLQAKVDELDRLLRGHLKDTSPTAHPQYVTHEEVDAVGLYPRAVEPDALLPFDYNDQIVNMRKYVSIDRNPIHSPDDTRSFMLEVVASEMDLRRRVVQEATQYEDLTEETMTSLRQLAEDYAAGLTPPSGEDEDAYREEQANLKYTELLADRVNLIDMKKYYRIGIVDSLNKDETAGMATSWSEWKLVGSGEISGQSNDYVVESDTTNDIISNRRIWYRVYKSGWVEQGGYVALNASDTFLTVQYPILLNSDPWNFHVDPIYANDGYHANGVRNMTAGGFEYFTNTGGDVMDVTGFYWEAKGYKA